MTATPLTWTCAKCHFPIDDGKGALAASYQAIRDQGPVSWVPLHDACDDLEDSYDIDVRRIRSIGDVDWWTDHLSGKTWHERSNWAAMLAAHGITSLERIS